MELTMPIIAGAEIVIQRHGSSSVVFRSAKATLLSQEATFSASPHSITTSPKIPSTSGATTMANEVQPESIYESVVAAITDSGFSEPSSMIRTILLRDRRFIGEKYRFESGYAIWHAEGSTVEVYNDDGSLLKIRKPKKQEEDKVA
jgi:hypothetical protein